MKYKNAFLQLMTLYRQNKCRMIIVCFLIWCISAILGQFVIIDTVGICNINVNIQLFLPNYILIKGCGLYFAQQMCYTYDQNARFSHQYVVLSTLEP
jgi:hypothetical protein